MKILKLRFANLNSLQGEWEIDFTRPEYVADGLFAITGPTGSGKSTILDAICLALYGQTPRLGRITKSSNEIMSRHAGECFAEVTFAAASGEFRCHWSQHRSRHRRGGELQAQKHEIADAVTGTLIQSRVQETLLEVEARTGMDFDRFTRSMLLAQGGFAAFLQADPDRRAPVLEQITGTELYSVISMKVHDRRKSEREQLDRLEIECAGIRLLGDEERLGLEEERSGLFRKEQALNTTLDADSAALRWLQEITRLEEALALIDAETVSLDEEREAFGTEELRLRIALEAATVEPIYAALSVKRDETGRLAGELDLKERLRPEVEAATDRAESDFEAAGRDLVSAEEAALNARPLIAQVRQLDLRIGDRLGDAGVKREEIVELERREEQLAAERDALAEALRKAQVTLQELREWQAARQVDATLSGAIPGIRQSLEALRPVSERERESSVRREVARRELDKSRQEMPAIESEAQVAEERFEQARSRLETLRNSFHSELGSSTMQSERQALDLLKERRRLFEEISALYVSGKELAPKIAEIDSALQESERNQAETAVRLDHARQILEHAEREARLHEERALLAARVRSLEEERSRLVEGCHCPLCGSTSHPYADGQQLVPADDAQALADARRSAQEASRQLRAQELLQAGLGKEIEQLRQRRNDLVQMREESGRQCLALLQKAGIQSPVRQAEPEVIAALQETTVSLTQLAERIERLEAGEIEVREQEATLLHHQEAAHTSQLQLEQLRERLRAKEAALTHQESEFDAARREHDERKSLFCGLLRPYGAETDRVDDPDAAVQALERRMKEWLNEEERSQRLEAEAASGEVALQNTESRLLVVRSDLVTRQTIARALFAEIEIARKERTALFRDKDPDEEERRTDLMVHTAREKRSEATDARNEARQALVVLDAAIADLRRTSQERRAELDLHEEDFRKALREKGFNDETAMLDARLDEARRAEIEARSEQLRYRQADLQARRSDREAQLLEELERRLTAESTAVLASNIERYQQELRDLRGRIGAISNQLDEHERLAAEYQSKQQAIESQKKECRRWETLHDLIGSADGKKFRNFAQGITFEIMITHANKQLSRMTDRYVLLHDPVGPLELSVIDQWQAGEIRSTRNLSGGESFIVSLALALGLSQMSSRNVRVDSLFLDEGFGTLDEESLETALKTLSSLQQSGKLIGIISHVPALRDRIATHIKVTPITGGRSAIEGPGTRAVPVKST